MIVLLELAIGDAYGAGFEFADEMIVANDLSQYVQHPRHDIQPGCYTDDTQMSLAIAEVLVSQEPWTEQVLAERFVRAFKRDPRVGYARKFYAFLQSIADGTEFLTQMNGTSDKSGAAMRSAPIGVLPTIAQTIAATTRQAAITHNSSDGINAAVAAALMSHYFIYHLDRKRHLGEFLETHVPGYNWHQDWEGSASAKGIACVHAAVTAVRHSDRMTDLLKTCIAVTGDVDTVAVIALAAASCSIEVEQNLPQHLSDRLENGTYGREYIIELDRRLMSLVDR
jgi:ADP-ribosylglycohydrolase